MIITFSPFLENKKNTKTIYKNNLKNLIYVDLLLLLLIDGGTISHFGISVTLVLLLLLLWSKRKTKWVISKLVRSINYFIAAILGEKTTEQTLFIRIIEKTYLRRRMLHKKHYIVRETSSCTHTHTYINQCTNCLLLRKKINTKNIITTCSLKQTMNKNAEI